MEEGEGGCGCGDDEGEEEKKGGEGAGLVSSIASVCGAVTESERIHIHRILYTIHKW